MMDRPSFGRIHCEMAQIGEENFPYAIPSDISFGKYSDSRSYPSRVVNMLEVLVPWNAVCKPMR